MAERQKSPLRTPQRNLLRPVLVFIFSLLIVSITIPDYGVAWDEPFSIFSADGTVFGLSGSYLQWLARPSLRKEWLELNWSPNHEHPPFAKLLIGLSHHLFRSLIGSTYSARVASALLFSALLVLVYLMMKRWFNWRVGIFASASLFLMPRVFAHAHLAELDIVLCLTTFAVIVGIEATARDIRYGPLLGFLWGVSLLTKINAIFLPGIFVPYLIWRLRRRAVLPLISSFLIGGLTFFAGWPWLWRNTAPKLQAFYAPLLEKVPGLSLPPNPYYRPRVNLPLYYLGRVFDERYPVSYPLVMLVVTVPVGILGLSLWGGRELTQNPVTVLLLLSVVTQTIPFLPRGSPKYDGVRLFLPVFPLVACFAGLGAERLYLRLKEARPRLALPCVALLVASQSFGILTTHPFELGYYNLLVGGMPGARKLGFETTYWGECIDRGVLDFLNNTVPEGGSVVFFPERDLVKHLLYADGFLRQDIKYLSPGAESDYVVILMREGMVLKSEFARRFLSSTPIFTNRKWGVVFSAVYKVERMVGDPSTSPRPGG